MHNIIPIVPKGVWICVDGVEGAGKTTIATRLAGCLGAVEAAEFSTAPFGAALRSAVRENPHHISSCAIGQSLVFLGDFLELVKTRVTPPRMVGRSVVTDRGYLSKYAYQEVVLETVLSTHQARHLLDTVFLHLPIPTLTILLSAPLATIESRLLERDGHCSSARLDFVERAAAMASARLQRLPRLESIVIDSAGPVESTFQQVLHALDGRLEASVMGTPHL